MGVVVSGKETGSAQRQVAPPDLLQESLSRSVYATGVAMSNSASNSKSVSTYPRLAGGRRVPHGRPFSRSSFLGAVRAPKKPPSRLAGIVSKNSKLGHTGIGKLLAEQWPAKFPRGHEEAEEFWCKIVDMFIAALSTGNTVVIKGLVTMQPYLKKGGTYFHPEYRKQMISEDKMHVRFTTLPTLREKMKAVKVPA